jgi:hypothetical protein
MTPKATPVQEDVSKTTRVAVVQIRFSVSATPRAFWLVCYLLAAPYASVCRHSLPPKQPLPRVCLIHATVMVLMTVGLPILCNWGLEQRERQDFVQRFRTLRVRDLAVATSDTT